MYRIGELLGFFLIVLFVLICAAALGTGLFYSIEIIGALVNSAGAFEPSVYVPLIVTVLTAILGLTAALATQSRIRKRETDAAHRERKLEIYLQFMQMLERAIIADKPELGDEPLEDDELARELLSIRTKAVLWGSPGVLRELSTLAKPNKTTKETLDYMEKIQREMRKDLGLSNFGLEMGFFAKLQLSDPSEYDELTRQGKRKNRTESERA